MTTDSHWKLFAGAVLLLTLSACGGGGGGSTPGGGGTTNRAPVANAGADQSVDEQLGVTLDGTGSSDPDNDSLTYLWTQTGGASVTLANPNASQASFNGPDVGIGSSTTLTFALRVSDSAGAINTDTVDIVVNGVSNTAPVADAGADQATTSAATVNLAGTGTDSDIGDVLSFSWTQLSGAAVTIADNDMANASFSAPNVGAGGETLTFQLAVDDGSATVTDTMEVTVSPAAALITLSGKVQYEYVPSNSNCNGLNFNAIQTRPIRAATVQLIDDATGDVPVGAAQPAGVDQTIGSGELLQSIQKEGPLFRKKEGSPGIELDLSDVCLHL